jgi:hypothetical protein
MGSGAEPERAWGYATPTGAPCPRCVRVDGTVEGSGDCLGCGYCVIVAAAAWASGD